MDQPSDTALNHASPAGVIPEHVGRSLIAWPNAGDFATEQAQLRQRLVNLASAAAKGAISPRPSRFLAGIRLLGRLIWAATASEKRMDDAIRNLPSAFEPTLKLSDWLRYAQACGISHVPFEEGPGLTQAEIEATHTAIGKGDYAALPDVVRAEVLPWIAQQQARGWMWRYQFCAAETIKRVLGCIRPANYLRVNRVAIPFSVDTRVLHCLWEARLGPEERTELIARPWIIAQFESGFPVEIRVYRTAEGFAASNYYVQRPLPEKYAPLLDLAVAMTEKFERSARSLAGSGLPQFPSTYSVDWILAENGELMLLEGGPGFTTKGGAHPCCFSIQGLKAGRRLLALEPGAWGYCPPAIQQFVDQIKGGANPIQVGKEAKLNPLALLAFAALQGDVRAQAALQDLERAIHHQNSQTS